MSPIHLRSWANNRYRRPDLLQIANIPAHLGTQIRHFEQIMPPMDREIGQERNFSSPHFGKNLERSPSSNIF